MAAELGEMKGALMKLGQMASYLDDALPEPLPPMSVELARQTIEEELGRPVDELFIEFDDEPIAAASIGQVHRAIAVVAPPTTGEPVERAVAVKVQYPGVAEAISSDLRNADLLGALLKQSFGGLDPSEMVDEIKLRLSDEVDYALEAENQRKFADYLKSELLIWNTPGVN